MPFLNNLPNSVMKDLVLSKGALPSYEYTIMPRESLTIKTTKTAVFLVACSSVTDDNVRSIYSFYNNEGNLIIYHDSIGPDRIGANASIVNTKNTTTITNNASTTTYIGILPIIGGNSITVNGIYLPITGQKMVLSQEIRGVVSAGTDLIIKNQNPNEIPFSYEIEMLLRQKPTTETWLPYYAKLACFGVSCHNTNTNDIVARSYTHAFSVSNNSEGDLVIRSVPVLGVGVTYDFEFCITPKIRCEALNISGYQFAKYQNGRIAGTIPAGKRLTIGHKSTNGEPFASVITATEYTSEFSENIPNICSSVIFGKTGGRHTYYTNIFNPNSVNTNSIKVAEDVDNNVTTVHSTALGITYGIEVLYGPAPDILEITD